MECHGRIAVSVIKERDIEHCANILTHQECNAERLGRAAREVWELNFSEARKFRAMLHSILELREKRDGIAIAITGSDGHHGGLNMANGWLPHQRLAKRIGRRLESVRNRLDK